MVNVIRRLSVLLVLVLTLASCAGAERQAISVGDSSITRTDLTELMLVFNPGGPEELPATLSAENYRGIANAWARDVAVTQALAEQGVSMTEDDIAQIDALIEDGIAQAQIADVEPDTDVYEAIRRLVWVGQRQGDLDEVSGPRAEQLLADADVESRIGVLDEESLIIVAG